MTEVSEFVADAVSTPNTSSSEDSDAPEFRPNETSDGYLGAFGDPKAGIGAFIDNMVNGDGDTIFERPPVNAYRLTREDIPRLREQGEREGWKAYETYWAIVSAMKSWLGDRQREHNDFGIGLMKDDDGRIVDWHESGYAQYFGATLPTIEVEEINADEAQALRDLGVDPETLGFRPDGLPVVPVFTGGRLPLVVSDYDELDEAIALIEEFPEEPSLGNVDDEEASTFPVLENGTIPDLKDYVDDHDPVPSVLEEMLAFEEAHQDRKGAKSYLRSITRSEPEAEDTDESVPEVSDEPLTVDEKVRAFNNLCEAGIGEEEAAERVGI